MARLDPMFFDELCDYILNHRTPGTKQFDRYFENPPESIPSMLGTMLANGWEDVSSSAVHMAELAKLIDNAEEADHIMTFPTEELADAWTALGHFCLGQGVRAEFFGEFSADISQKTVEVHLDWKVGEEAPRKLEVTFVEPLAKTMFKILIKE